MTEAATPRRALLWALPDGWVSFELFQPDVEEQIGAHIRGLWAGAGLDPAGAADVVAQQVHFARRARQAGVLLIAASAHGAGTPEEPLSALSLTLALRPLPVADAQAADSTPSAGNGVASAPSPLVLQDSTLCGFIRESWADTLFTVEALIAPREGDLVAILAVSTPDPTRSDEARAVAREVADTLGFLTLEPPASTATNLRSPS